MRVAALLSGLLLAHSVSGAEQAKLHLELNKLEARDDGCRVHMLFKNERPQAFESLELDLVIFDRDAVVARRLVVQGGPIPGDKTMLKTFDIADLSCAKVGRVLLNGVLECSGGSADGKGCLDAVRTSTRADVEFIR